ncbi:MAG TPA: acyl carrier protein [Gemmatimonadales bacterium]|jgi:acyl carrier protein
MTVPEILERTRAYVRENFLYMRPDFPLGDGDRLLAKGIVDSMGVAELLGFLEAEFGVMVTDEDITEEHLGTLNAIARYVAPRLRRTDAA